MFRRLPLLLACMLETLSCAKSVAPSEAPARVADPASTPKTDECITAEQCEHQCERELPRACLSLAYMLETGRGTPQSYEKAAKLYAVACALGAVEACTHLGMMNDVGLIGGANANSALYLYERACKLGDSWSCRRSVQLKPR